MKMFFLVTCSLNDAHRCIEIASAVVKAFTHKDRGASFKVEGLSSYSKCVRVWVWGGGGEGGGSHVLCERKNFFDHYDVFCCE